MVIMPTALIMSMPELIHDTPRLTKTYFYDHF